MICKGKEGVGGKEGKMELASCVAVGRLCTVGNLCGSL
jgi:hypothetical protein